MDQPAPRTIRLRSGLFLSAGLVLRLRGLRWGLDLEQSLHPDEWPFIVIYQISQGDFSEIGRSVSYNTYHLFSALVALVLRKGVYLRFSTAVQPLPAGSGSPARLYFHRPSVFRTARHPDFLPGLSNRPAPVSQSPPRPAGRPDHDDRPFECGPDPLPGNRRAPGLHGDPVFSGGLCDP